MTRLFWMAAFAVALLAAPQAHAQQLISSYVALLSQADHFNSNGQRLTTAAEVIRQDRANYHRFGIRDGADQNDPYFGDMNNRAALENMINRGGTSAAVQQRIINSTPLVQVDIYRAGGNDYVFITILN